MEGRHPEGVVAAVLNLQPKATLSVAYHQLYGSHDDLILLELDQKLLDDILHRRVFIRGQSDEDAVLCTQSKTYAMKFVGTSNSVFLVPPSNQIDLDWKPSEHNHNGCGEEVASVLKLAPGNIKLVEVTPKLDKLRLLLSKNYYRLDDVSEMETEGMEVEKPKLYGWSDLVSEVQASDDEIKIGLRAISAVVIDGYWRLVEEPSMDMPLRMLLNNSVLNDWIFNALNEDGSRACLGIRRIPSCHRTSLFSCVRRYGRWACRHICVEAKRETGLCAFCQGCSPRRQMRLGNFMEC